MADSANWFGQLVVLSFNSHCEYVANNMKIQRHGSHVNHLILSVGRQTNEGEPELLHDLLLLTTLQPSFPFILKS